MATTEKTISGLVGRQLPDFVRADHPKFQLFIEKYYKWLESEGTFTQSGNTYNYGNTVYNIMNVENFRDIDETKDEFVSYFKNELLPYFPENTALSIPKILKGAREFYVKKGSEESLKWLFTVLFGEDIDIIYPKKQILRASGGVWKIPRIFQLILSAQNLNINPDLLLKRRGVGSESKSACVIEFAAKRIENTFGYEILEIYASNIDNNNNPFINGENLEIVYEDENGELQTFVERIAGTVSSITVNPSRRGLSHNIGDPVVFSGGLDNTNEARDAEAAVSSVSVGSIEGIIPVFYGYGYRTFANSSVTVLRSATDETDANIATNVTVSAIDTINYGENIIVDIIPIEYMESVIIGGVDSSESPGYGAVDYAYMTANNRNIQLTVTEENSSNLFNNLEAVYADGANYAEANLKGYIATTNTTSPFGEGGSAVSGTLVLYSVSNTKTITTGNFPTLFCVNTGAQYTVTAVGSTQLQVNANSKIAQGMEYEELVTGGVQFFEVYNGGFGFSGNPSIIVSSLYQTKNSESRQPVSGYGQIAKVRILNGGTGYANGDLIHIEGRGYGFSGYVNVNATGHIVTTTITSRGEGYFGDKSVLMNVASTTSGANAVLQSYSFAEGLTYQISTGSIGAIQEIVLLNRGYDYVTEPVVSLKVLDMVIEAIPEEDNFSEGEHVYQGGSLESATFSGRVKSFNRSRNTLRLFNVSGYPNGLDVTVSLQSDDGVSFSVNTSATVTPPAAISGYADAYSDVRATGLPNPWLYGDGRAAANIQFFNGLIDLPGFYVGTGGFVSADNYLQDENKYHNYSYVLNSRRSLAEYKNSVLDIAHPAGMKLLGQAVLISRVEEPVIPQDILYLNPPLPGNSNVTIADSTSNTITGNLTEFESANANDIIIIIDSVNLLRSQAKIIKVINSNTDMEVEGNFLYIGQGRISTTFNSCTATVFSNTNTLSSFMVAGDTVQINVAASRWYSQQTGSVTVIAGNNTVVGSGTNFSVEFDDGDYIRVNNQIKIIDNIVSSTIMTVNSAFSYNGSSHAIYRHNTSVSLMNAAVVSISESSVVLNTTMMTDMSNNFYSVIPDYSADYTYKLITITDD